jgi:hypothetical protein
MVDILSCLKFSEVVVVEIDEHLGEEEEFRN